MYKLFKLNNGLRIVVENIDYVKSVSVGLWIENGSRNESLNNNGISHFIEHMMFKGTYKRTAKQIAEEIEDIGGQMNAFTGKEATCFYTKTLDTNLELSLDILSDMILNSKLEDKDIEKEKSVIVEEINMSEDSPEDVLSDIHSISTWGKDPLSYPILGNIDTVKSFNSNMLKEYMDDYYTPLNAVISICGNFEIDSIEELVEKYFGNWKFNNKKEVSYSSPDILNHHLCKKKPIEQLHINLGLQGIPLGEDNIYTLLLLNNVFGGGVSSLLFQKVREELGLCYSVYSYTSSYNNTGALNIYTGVNPKQGVEAIQVINEELKKFILSGITKEKLSKSKIQIKASYMLGLESTSSRMFSNGKSVLFLNKVNTPEDIIRKIDSINNNTIQDVFENCFKGGILNSAFVGNIDISKLAKGTGLNIKEVL